MPDEPIQTPETAAVPEPTPAPSPADSTPSAPAPSFSTRDYLKSQNLNVDSFQDDKSVVDALLNIYREHEQAKPFIPYGREYAQNREQFELWRRAQAEQLAKQQAPVDKKSWWTKPEFDPNWQNQVILDNQGNYVPKQGYPTDIAAKMNAYVAHQRKVIQDFTIDPMAMLRPGVEEVAREIAQKMVDEKLAGFQTQQFIQSFEQQNANWLFQQGPNGTAYDPVTGQPQTTPVGREFYAITKSLRDKGVTNPRDQEEIARSILGTRIAQTSQSPEQVNAAKKQEFLRQPSHGGSFAPPTNPSVIPPPQNSNLSIHEMMRANMKAEGITDEEFVRQFARI